MVPIPTPSWREINPDTLQNRTLKAEGAGAAVYHALLPPASSAEKSLPVAIRKPRIRSAASITRFEDELHLRSKIDHPNLLPLIAACSSAPNYCTVSPWMAGGTLFDLIHTNSVHMSFERILRLSLQLARAMAYMHSVNLVHRDLKTSNVLLDAKWENLVVADLDLAADVTDLHKDSSHKAGRAMHRGPSNGRLSHMVGTLVYMAPEVLSGKPHTFAADVYAFAIAVNEMTTAAVPFVDRKMPVPELHTVLETRFNEVRLRSAIVKDRLRPMLSPGVAPELNALIERGWHHDPKARPSFDEVISILQNILDRGPDFLQTFPGSMPAVPMSNGTTDPDSEPARMLGELIECAANPPQPIWLSRTGAVSSGASRHPPSKPLTIVGALSSTCGDRGEDSMEDRSVVQHKVADLDDTHLFAVFDGHGGQACSEFASQHIAGALMRAWGKEEATPDSALVHAFEDVDTAFLASTARDEKSGSTALAAFIVGHTLYVANAGDCRCVLGRDDGGVVELSKDHVATDETEQARIGARGGTVTCDGRVEGFLMVSRAMGDRFLKRYITATPDVSTHRIEDADDFLVLASDGLWDVVSSQEAVDMVRSTVRVPDLAAKRLALRAIELGSDDNISVIVVLLRGTVSFSSI